MYFSLFHLILVTGSITLTKAQQQKFRVSPHNLQVLEGSEALLRCEISNLKGNVQWVKNGYGLGN